MKALRAGLLTFFMLCAAGSGCHENATKSPAVSPAPISSSPLVLSILDAKLDSSTGTILLVLEFKPTEDSVLLDIYHLEYAISLNGNPFIALGPIKWRHRFGVDDLVTISAASPYVLDYYYPMPDTAMEQIRTIRIRATCSGGNEELLELLTQLGCKDTDRYRNTWYGQATSREFTVGCLNSWHGETGRRRFGGLKE